MELTTTFQRIGKGTQKTYGGSAGYLELWAKYNSQDIPNNKTNVTVELRLVVPYGYIGNYQSTYWNISGSLAGGGDLGSANYYSRTLGSVTGDIKHEADGSKSVSFNGSFNPTAWYQIIEVSGSATLPNLHKPPVVDTMLMGENNQQLNDLHIDLNKITQYLSIKTFIPETIVYDEATIVDVKMYHNNILIGELNNGNILVDFYQVGKLVTTKVNNKDYVSLMVVARDSLGGTSSKIFDYEVYLYDKPTYDGVKTNILRKSDYNTSLIDNYALLNFYGNFYKNTTDPIGLHNSCVVEYKIWQDGTTEPANYITLQTTIIDNQVKVEDYLLSNIDFLTIYNYKIRITDTFDSTGSIKESTIPLGVATWTEFADRVDFLKLTVQDYNPFEYSEDETICGVWNDGFDETPIYRKVIDFGYLSDGSTTASVSHDITNLGQITRIEAIGNDGQGRFFPIPFAPVSYMYGNIPCSIRIDSANIYIYSNGDFSDFTAYVILEYTKTQQGGE